MKNSFFPNTIENIRKRLNLDPTDKSDTQRILNRQCNLSFDDKIAEYEKFSLYSLKREGNELVKPIYVGFLILKISKLKLFEWYYDESLPYFVENNLQVHCIDTGSFIFPFKPIKGSLED